MKIPVKPFHINQSFGQNLNDFYRQQKLKGHGGLDLGANHGQPIYASHDGTCYPQIDDRGGNGVVLLAFDTIEYKGQQIRYRTLYWHMVKDDAVVHTGQIVKQGDLLGYANNTGTSTGDHLHFGLIPTIVHTDPNLYWTNLEPDNGYNGAIDPEPYLDGTFAQDISNPNPIPTSILRLGAWNADVKALQTRLVALGYTLGAIDGHYGPKTFEALKSYQRANGLVPDGVAGPLTFKALWATMK